MIASTLHQRIPPREIAYAQFVADYPDYLETASLDQLRLTEYERLDRLGHTYLDYTGGGIYASSQLRAHHDLLQAEVYGNPHSSNPTSQAATHLNEQTRAYVLSYFKADPAEYEVIFTLNASGALKLVGESYPFCRGGRFVLTFDNHNSVNGIREFASAKGSKVDYIPVVPPDLRVDESKLRAALNAPGLAGHNLFAYPAQSNFSGVKHPLEWIEYAQARGWDVLVDFAAYAPTSKIDLSRWKPDFIDLSFYKMFGYPTGIGCLLARRQTAQKLHRPWFAGGTIQVASVQANRHVLAEGETGFEDGTINYLNIPAIEIGLRHLESIGVDLIQKRVMALTGWFIQQLVALRHSNGAPVVKIYGPTTSEGRGGTVAFNFYDPSGMIIEYSGVEEQANREKISLRTGCFCNPGAAEAGLGFSKAELDFIFAQNDRITFHDFYEISARNGRTAGAARVSFGIVSNFEDVYRFLVFAERFIE
jgi:selenocysteine lyase/cysteine desulfurase